MKHFRNVSTVKCGVSENPAKGLCNLPILNKLQSVTVGRRPQLRRDCDSRISTCLSENRVGRRPQLRRDCDATCLAAFFVAVW